MKLLDLTKADQEKETEIKKAIQEVIRNGQFIQGNDVNAFEKVLGTYLGVAHVISCANGTDALYIALKALNLPHASEVLMPSFNYVASAETACALGLRPVFVDVEPNYFGMDVRDLERKLSANSSAIVAVHLFGHACDMPFIMAIANRHGLKVIEDNAQSLGARINNRQAGTIGHIATASFFPTKNLGCYGDGGAIYTHDKALAEACRIIASHGQQQKYHYARVGINSRLDTLQAAILNVKLPALDSCIRNRVDIAEKYMRGLRELKEVILPQTKDGYFHTYNQFTLRVLDGSRDALRAFLNTHDIPTMVYYPIPLHKTTAYQAYAVESLKETEKLTQCVLSLPIYPNIPYEDVAMVIEGLKTFYK